MMSTASACHAWHSTFQNRGKAPHEDGSDLRCTHVRADLGASAVRSVEASRSACAISQRTVSVPSTSTSKFPPPTVLQVIFMIAWDHTLPKVTAHERSLLSLPARLGALMSTL